MLTLAQRGAESALGVPKDIPLPALYYAENGDAYREGAAAGMRATAPSSDDSSGGNPASSPTQPQTPPWATALARRQKLRDAGFVATQTLREGDRPAAGSGPDLKDKS
jgi:type IV secretory pathway TrbL component